MTARFLTSLRVEELEDISHDGRGTWRLLSDLMYESALAGQTFTVKAGFVTDFASVPRIPVVFLLCGDTAHAAAVVHDWLYTNHLCSRADADAILREAAIACGVPAWRAQMLWTGVTAGGWLFWNSPATVQSGPQLVVKQPEIEAA